MRIQKAYTCIISHLKGLTLFYHNAHEDGMHMSLRNDWTVNVPKNKELGWELSVSAFAALYNTLVRPHLEYATQAQTLLKCCLFGAIPAVGNEAREGFPPTAIWGTTTPVGTALLIQASPLWRPHCRIQNVFRGVLSDPQSLFYSASAAWLERSSFQSSAGS